MNPPTRPGTAASQGRDEKVLPNPRLVMSNRILSYQSITSSRRPLKYCPISHVELVPQPSDDPDDPLVSDNLLRDRPQA